MFQSRRLELNCLFHNFLVVAEDRDGLLLFVAGQKVGKKPAKGNLSNGFPLDSFQSTRVATLDPENHTVINILPITTIISV